MADRWEHLCLHVWWDTGAKAWNHSYDHRSLRNQADVAEILNYFGANGWELVSFAPDSKGTNAGAPAEWSTGGYTAVFKRRKS